MPARSAPTSRISPPAMSGGSKDRFISSTPLEKQNNATGIGMRVVTGAVYTWWDARRHGFKRFAMARPATNSRALEPAVRPISMTMSEAGWIEGRARVLLGLTVPLSVTLLEVQCARLLFSSSSKFDLFFSCCNRCCTWTSVNPCRFRHSNSMFKLFCSSTIFPNYQIEVSEELDHQR